MSTPSLNRRRDPSEDDRRTLHDSIEQAAWQHARTVAGLEPGEPPRSPASALLDEDGKRDAQVALVAALRDVRDELDGLIDHHVAVAGQLSAGGPALAAALRVTPQAVQKRWPHAVPKQPGPRPRLTRGVRTASSPFAAHVLHQAGLPDDRIQEAGGGAVAVLSDGSRVEVRADGRDGDNAAWWAWTVYDAVGEVEHDDAGGTSASASQAVRQWLAVRGRA